MGEGGGSAEEGEGGKHYLPSWPLFQTPFTRAQPHPLHLLMSPEHSMRHVGSQKRNSTRRNFGILTSNAKGGRFTVVPIWASCCCRWRGNSLTDWLWPGTGTAAACGMWIRLDFEDGPAPLIAPKSILWHQLVKMSC
jgi:hypothetical protein